MTSSNNQLQEAIAVCGKRQDLGFALIVAFDFYDGPERGLAIYPSGEGVRFVSLGDSRSRLFRAFELTFIGGDWWAMARALPELASVATGHRVLVPAENSETLDQLDRAAFSANAEGRYVGVGSPSLEWLSMTSLTDEQLESLKKLDCSPAGYQLAHQIVKSSA